MSLQKPVAVDDACPDALELAAVGGGTIAQPNVVVAPAVRVVAPAPSKAMQTRATILTGPMMPTLLKLALPTVTVLLAQTAVNIAEANYVGFLGTDALAGVALVFSEFLLMKLM